MTMEEGSNFCLEPGKESSNRLVGEGGENEV